MDFESIEPATFENATSPVLFSSDNHGVRDTDILTNTYWKTVYTISCFHVHILDCLTCIKKEFAKKFSNLVKPSIEAAFTEHTRH
jgi:hypothetical protein